MSKTVSATLTTLLMNQLDQSNVRLLLLHFEIWNFRGSKRCYDLYFSDIIIDQLKTPRSVLCESKNRVLFIPECSSAYQSPLFLNRFLIPFLFFLRRAPRQKDGYCLPSPAPALHLINRIFNFISKKRATGIESSKIAFCKK